MLAAVLAGLVIYGVTKPGARSPVDARLEAGRAGPAPPFDLPLLGAGAIDRSWVARNRAALADGRLSPAELRGRPVVLNFWASWCFPCRLEAPVLRRAWARERGSATFVGLNMQDTESKALRFMRRYAVTYPNVRDPRDAVARRWGLVGIPETFFLSARGRVVAHVTGRISDAQMSAGVRAARAGRVLGALRGGASRRPR